MALNYEEELTLPYRNVSKDGRPFLLEGIDGIRDYTERLYMDREIAETINENDKLLLLTGNQYPFTTDDIGRIIYHLLKNKILPSARQHEIDKIYPYIRRAFME